MWDTVDTSTTGLGHDLPCFECGHATHSYLPCSDDCECVPSWVRDLAGRPPEPVAA